MNPERNRVFGSRSLNYKQIGLIFVNLVLPRRKKLGFSIAFQFKRDSPWFIV